MKKLALTTLLAAGILLSGCQAPGEQSPEVTSVQTQAALQTAAEPELPPTLDEKPERFTLAEYPCTTDNLRIDGNDPWLFDFRYSAACGFGKDGTYRDAEMYYGLKGELSSTQLSYWFYDYDLGGVTVKSAQLINDSSSRDILLKEKAITINTKELDAGLYYIKAELSDGSRAFLAFYTDGGDSMFCTVSGDKDSAKLHTERRKRLYDLIELFEVKPGNSYETMRLTYPRYPYDESYRCDTDLWIQLSSEITRPDWTDGRKLLTIYDWLSDNLAYDNYMADVLGERREVHYGDWTGTYNMYSTHVGVCWDFANVLITMCRAQKIPAVSIENDGASHMWVAVYIGNEWYEIDPTADVNDVVDGEDMTVITKAENPERYVGYFSLVPNGYGAQDMLTINHMLWTAERDSSGYCLRRPKVEYTTDSAGKIIMIL